MKPLLIIKTGSTFAETLPSSGDFEDWTRSGLGLGAEEIMTVAVCEDQTLPDVSTICAAVITGSHAMVTDQTPWIKRTSLWLEQAVTAGLPVLGICFGHQLLAEALGGRADWNPHGREIGTVEIQLTQDGCKDALLGTLPQRFPAQVTHSQSAVKLPPGSILLATSVLDHHQAFRLGSCWGVQFHPEFSSADVRYYIDRLRHNLEAEGLDPEQLFSNVESTPAATSVLRRFAKIVRDTLP